MWALGAAARLPDRATLLDELGRVTGDRAVAPVTWERLTFHAAIDLREADGQVLASVRIDTTHAVALVALLIGVFASLVVLHSCSLFPFAWLALTALLTAPAALVHAIVATRLLLRRVRAVHIPGARLLG